MSIKLPKLIKIVLDILFRRLNIITFTQIEHFRLRCINGELAQMVERSLSMREVTGSMPVFSS